MLYRFYFLLFFVAIFSKIFAIYFTKFDLFGDEAQYWVWSQNLDWGYYSKPPLLAWVIGGFTFLFGDSFIVIKIIPFTFYLLTSYVVYLISFQLYKIKDLAIVTALSFYLIPAVSISSFLLSTDIILIFFWSVCLLFLLKIREKPSIKNFIFLGISLGLAFLSKYAAIYYILSFIILIFLDKRLKVVILQNLKGVFFQFLISFIILVPNIYWNVKNGWITLAHTSDNAALNRLNFNFLGGVEFLLSQALMVGPIIILFFLFVLKKIKYEFQTIFLLSFSMPIFLIVFLEAILVRANANWAAVALIPFFILVFYHVRFFFRNAILFSNLINIGFCVIFFSLVSLTSSLEIFNRINGINFFAEELNKNHLGDKAFLIIEDRLIYSNLKYLYRNSDIIFFSPHKPGSSIKNHFQLTKPLLANFKNDFILIGKPEDVSYLQNEHKFKKIYFSKKIFKKQPIGIYEVSF